MTNYQFPLAVSLVALSASYPVHAMTVLQPSESVMTSSFFQGTNTVRGYSGEGRDVFRVSTNDPFDTPGAETIYMAFDFDPADFSESIGSAVLSVTSIDGGFNANAGPGNPFLVSAHGVNADPFSSITDDTNPDGAIAWNTFLSDNILAAAGSTSVDSFGVIEIDVTPLVNEWIAGSNSEFSIALTGKNDMGTSGFLHGFSNDTEVPGATFLTIAAVPEPSTALFCLLGVTFGISRRQRNRQL